ncbi:thermonuclease [Bacillus aerolatus]|uniref:Thermonuclease n=1 Tax=Bacillus aerolatus TaxID=2653354 RepID=A0A6I1FP72_9BACI|nr:thermonuclease family protein [Bacillus aerolatus]KAB7708206.1 thermonuclease [Bacillus aerolatus]
MMKVKSAIFIAAFFLLGGCAVEEQKEELTKDSSETVVKEETTEQANEQPSLPDIIDGDTAEKKGITGTVFYVVDGDTFDIKLPNGKEERIRMTLVDTPETKHPRLGVQPFGPEASAFTKKVLMNKKVTLEFDVQERDRYGRILAYVWLDGKMVNEQLIAKGLARTAVFPPNTKYVDRFEKVQKEAREQKVGIWLVENYVTDRGYNTILEKEKIDAVTDPTGKCRIKGNISSSGEKIYHVPGNQSYEVTKPEQTFCSKEEAEAAGFRAAKR